MHAQKRSTNSGVMLERTDLKNSENQKGIHST